LLTWSVDHDVALHFMTRANRRRMPGSNLSTLAFATSS
jgi:hypothetical protein